MKTVSFEKNLCEEAMFGLVELKDVLQNEFIDQDEPLADVKWIRKTIIDSLNKFEMAKSISSEYLNESEKTDEEYCERIYS